MVGPIEQIGTTTGTPGVARPPRAGQAAEGDFAAVLRQATTGASPAATQVPAAAPVDLATTLERMQRVTAHLQQARAYFQPPATATPPQIEAEA